MPRSQDGSLMDLLKDYISREGVLQQTVEKLDSEGYTVRTLLEMPDDDLHSLISELFSDYLYPGAKMGFKTAIGSRKKRKHADSTAEGEGSREEAVADAKRSYFEKLLEPPPELPRGADELKDFLSLRPRPLPIRDPSVSQNIREPQLMVVDTSAAADSLASFCAFVFDSMKNFCPENEATSSAELFNLTANFLKFLNNEAPEDRKLRGFRCVLDSANRSSTSAASRPLAPLVRPDFRVFVQSCLILRWENKIDLNLLDVAIHENASKLEAWSPLFYGKLPYVIGGCCAGRQFQWLKLSPKGDVIISEVISAVYDLNLSCDVAKFLLSTIRMHCLLQKLQEKIDSAIRVALYSSIKRANGVVVTVHPNYVKKVIPELDTAKWTMLNSLYESIAGSKYLIQRVSFRISKGKTSMKLQPVGDPLAKPDNLRDFGNAIHDMLNGLADLHGNGYTHRDLRWDNCIKVNDKSNWKWVIIDLEAAGRDNEEWVGKGLTGWDAETLEEDKKIAKKKSYTKGSDMYQLGKLMAEWLDNCLEGGQVLRSLAKQLQQKRTAAVEVLKDVCKKNCDRCRMFGTKL